jgi:hypothetical protein
VHVVRGWVASHRPAGIGRSESVVRRSRILGLASGLALIAGAESGSQAQATRARITDLSDVAFGPLSGVGDAYVSQSVCAFSTNGGYFVTASGSGSGGAFALASGANSLPFEVMWAASPGQTIGTALAAGVASPVFASSATQHSCNSGPPSSASLIVVIRANTVSSAQAGAYQGVLTVVIAPQ